MTQETETKKVYLGDGAYAEYDGYGIQISCDRRGLKHYVYLEPEVLAALENFVAACYSGRVKELGAVT